MVVIVDMVLISSFVVIGGSVLIGGDVLIGSFVLSSDPTLQISIYCGCMDYSCKAVQYFI